MLKGIDISEHQGRIDWDKVKGQIDFAILRVGYGSDISNQDDKQFKRNADECTRLGIPFGVYLYSYANSIEKAKSEAQHVLRLIKGYKLSYPIYYDLEDANTTGKCSNNLIANMAQNFCNIIESSGYWVGIYANTYWLNNKLTNNVFDRWVKWVAQYASKCTYSGKYGIWQYSSSGSVSGINGNVDMNYGYEDYPSKIGYKPVSKPIQKPVVKEIKTWELNISGSLITTLQHQLNIQFNAGIKEDSYAGDLTIDKLPIVKKGARGEITKVIQKLLIRKGFSVGNYGADAVFGGSTYDAIIAFQKANGLAADGIVGKNTWKALLRK